MTLLEAYYVKLTYPFRIALLEWQRSTIERQLEKSQRELAAHQEGD